MNKADRLIFTKLLYQFGTQSMTLAAVLGVLNAEIPDFKQKAVGALERLRPSKLTEQAMLDEAIDYLKTLP
jgi:hypothetical protein